MTDHTHTYTHTCSTLVTSVTRRSLFLSHPSSHSLGIPMVGFGGLSLYLAVVWCVCCQSAQRVSQRAESTFCPGWTHPHAVASANRASRAVTDGTVVTVAGPRGYVLVSRRSVAHCLRRLDKRIRSRVLCRFIARGQNDRTLLHSNQPRPPPAAEP